MNLDSISNSNSSSKMSLRNRPSQDDDSTTGKVSLKKEVDLNSQNVSKPSIVKNKNQSDMRADLLEERHIDYGEYLSKRSKIDDFDMDFQTPKISYMPSIDKINIFEGISDVLKP
jgi:hypothetical protein